MPPPTPLKPLTPTASRPSVLLPATNEQLPSWTLTWLAGVHTHCTSLDQCANEFGVTWRYQVPEFRRSQKREGMCLCKCYVNSPIALPRLSTPTTHLLKGPASRR